MNIFSIIFYELGKVYQFCFFWIKTFNRIFSTVFFQVIEYKHQKKSTNILKIFFNKKIGGFLKNSINFYKFQKFNVLFLKTYNPIFLTNSRCYFNEGITNTDNNLQISFKSFLSTSNPLPLITIPQPSAHPRLFSFH